jgi:hypothetical protein
MQILMCYFSIVTDELESGAAWALGPHRLVCGKDSDAEAFSAIDAATGAVLPVLPPPTYSQSARPRASCRQ